jgi:hypothetical protein
MALKVIPRHSNALRGVRKRAALGCRRGCRRGAYHAFWSGAITRERCHKIEQPLSLNLARSWHPPHA